jgi:putative PIN family toxin of toxin-antitoxin system
MIRVLVDTNVYVSALVFGGRPAVVLQLAESGAFELVVSATIKAELIETLTTRFGWSARRAEQACRKLWDEACWVVRPQAVQGSRDPDDDHVLSCALGAQAQAIVTGDQDLLALHPFRGVEILAPADLLVRRFWERRA